MGELLTFWALVAVVAVVGAILRDVLDQTPSRADARPARHGDDAVLHHHRH